MELIFLGIILFYFIIQILSTDCDHWIFYIIQISTYFSASSLGANFSLGATFWGGGGWANNIGRHDDFLLDILQQTYWLQTQVKYLIVQS